MPRWFTRLRLRLRSLIFHARVERELQEELNYHLTRSMEERLAGGLQGREAHESARRSMGAVAQNMEACRDMRGLNIVQYGVQDLRYALRQLARQPAFACTAVVMLALGVAASVSIFGFVEAALIRPLPYHDQSALVSVFGTWKVKTARANLSYLDYVNMRERNQTFSSIDVYDVRTGRTLTTAAGTERIATPRVSAGFFRTLGVSPIIGRDFVPTDEGAGASGTVLLTWGAWQTRFGGRPDVVGETLTLDGEPHAVIGVLPRDFHFAPIGPADAWTTIRWAQGTISCWQRRGCRSLQGIARLPNGISIRNASETFDGVMASLREQYPESDRDLGVNLVPLREVIVGEVRPVLYALISAAGLLLVIASINIVSLLLARSDSRMREIAVRNALGASARRLAQQFAVEAVTLVAIGGAIGLLLAAWTMRLLTMLLSAAALARMPYLATIGLNLRLVQFAAVVLIMAAAVFALAPLTRISRSARVAGLKEANRGSAGMTWRRFGAGLVVAQLALAVVLLVGAGLLGKSLSRLLGLDVGLNPDHLLTLSVGPKPGELTKEESFRFSARVAERVLAVPGVTAVGYAEQLPLAPGIAPTSNFWVMGRAPEAQREESHPSRRVSAGYFVALQARLLRGRYFTEPEVTSMRPVMIINQSAAERYFPGADPIGQSIVFGRPGGPDASAPREIVGVIADIKDGPLEMTPRPAAYVPFDVSGGSALVVRVSRGDSTLFPSIASAIRELWPGASVSGQMTMRERMNRLPSAHLHRSSAWVVGGFATLAFVLSVVGLYGVVSYSVGLRRREIGVRMALGAARSSVYRLVIGEAAWVVCAGAAIGVLAAIGTATMMRGLLFGVRSWDIETLVVVCVVLVTAALFASYVPARRAASVDPLEVLRAE
jgi:macrolide transport system ATP-binding/permease protein